MKRRLFLILRTVVLLLTTVGSASAQLKPWEFPKVTEVNDLNFELYSQKGQKARRADLIDVKRYMTPDNAGTINNVPSTTGNTLNLMSFVKDPNGEVWYIDAQGEAVSLGCGSGGGGSSAWEYRTVTTTTGSPFVVVSGTIPTNLAHIEVQRNGIVYKTGAPGCTDCNVVYDIVDNEFIFFRSLNSMEVVVVKIRN
jgi:hypothetical protein